MRTMYVLTALLACPLSMIARAGSNDAKAVYEQKCKGCHSIGGDGGKLANLGGKLDGVGTKRDPAWLESYIADPKSQMPDARMPRFRFEPAELRDLVAYMQTLK